MSKPILAFNRGLVKYTLGMDYVMSAIEKSELFEIKEHNDAINDFRGYRALLIYLNDKKIYMDFWEYPNPTYSMGVIKYNPDLIIKLQHKQLTYEQFISICKRKNFIPESTEDEKKNLLEKIVPFTFFPSRMMHQFIDKEDSMTTEPINKIGFFCGKNWKCRHGIQKKIRDENIEYNNSDQQFSSGRTLSDEEYIKNMKQSKFGIVLHGRSSMLTDAKNRREIDYMMMKKPLLLNYRPYYYNPLIEGKHYIYIDENTDFKNLENKYNIQEIVNNATQWYNDNASPQGVVKVFMQILNDRKIL